jgi:hypothetical protein
VEWNCSRFDWSSHRRLYEYCGDIPPVELETAYHAQQRAQPTAEFSHLQVTVLTSAVHTDGMTSRVPSASGDTPNCWTSWQVAGKRGPLS